MLSIGTDDRPILVIAPHPDDEVLGAGGTIARFAGEGREVHVCVVTRGRPPRFDPEQSVLVRREAETAHSLLAVAQTHWLDHGAAELDVEAHGALNASLADLVRHTDAGTILLPHVGDIHMDHQRVFLSALVASRPGQNRFPTTLLAYETLSETNWNAPYLSPGFLPNVFVDISATLEVKIEAFQAFGSQVKPPPHERSVDSIRALAVLRGATVHAAAAEGFVLIRARL